MATRVKYRTCSMQIWTWERVIHVWVWKLTKRNIAFPTPHDDFQTSRISSASVIAWSYTKMQTPTAEMKWAAYIKLGQSDAAEIKVDKCTGEVVGDGPPVHSFFVCCKAQSVCYIWHFLKWYWPRLLRWIRYDGFVQRSECECEMEGRNWSVAGYECRVMVSPLKVRIL